MRSNKLEPKVHNLALMPIKILTEQWKAKVLKSGRNLTKFSAYIVSTQMYHLCNENYIVLYCVNYNFRDSNIQFHREENIVSCFNGLNVSMNYIYIPNQKCI